MNNRYTVVATTEIDGKEYRVVSQYYLETELIVEMCDQDCYIIKNDRLNMMLKYY
ncbi:MAG: hypothetical protein R2744_08065 [Bacteroidales bacterium]